LKKLLRCHNNSISILKFFLKFPSNSTSMPSLRFFFTQNMTNLSQIPPIFHPQKNTHTKKFNFIKKIFKSFFKKYVHKFTKRRENCRQFFISEKLFFCDFKFQFRFCLLKATSFSIDTFWDVFHSLHFVSYSLLWCIIQRASRNLLSIFISIGCKLLFSSHWSGNGWKYMNCNSWKFIPFILEGEGGLFINEFCQKKIGGFDSFHILCLDKDDFLPA